MTDVLSITGPIFLLIGVGYLAVKGSVIPQASLPGMGRFVLHFSLPALIFSTISTMEFGTLIEPVYLAVYGVSSLLTLLLGLTFSYTVWGQPLATSGVMGLGMSMSNSAFIGFPVLLQVFGEPPAQAFAMSLMVENILIMPIALAIIEYGIRDRSADVSAVAQGLAIVHRLIRNPLLLAIAAGMVFSLMDFSLTGAVKKSLDMLAGASVAVALFTIGGTLVGNPVRGDLASISTVLVGKLILHPLLVFLLLMLAPGLSPELRLSMMLLSAMPMLSVFPIIGSNYGVGRLCASTLLLTTVFSFLSLTALLVLLT
ncbi:MAG: AEC family transporter [Marinobacter sp.]|nr:AEC family transporter [Marinobacter sp.]